MPQTSINAPVSCHEPQTPDCRRRRRSGYRVVAAIITLACALQSHSVFALFVDASNGIDTGNCAAPASPCQSIEFAIGNAVPGDVINLRTSAGSSNRFKTAGLSIPFNLTIRTLTPNRAIIDAGLNDRIFTVNGGNLLLDRVILQNGNAGTTTNGIGGAVRLVTGSLTVQNSIIQNNTASMGGAIAAENTAGTVRIISSILRDNRSTASGGAIHCDGCNGVLVWTSNVYRNTAGVQGGAAFIQSSSLATHFSRLGWNHANDGGAIFANNSQVIVHDSELRDNEANQGDGGGIFSAGNLSIQRSTLEGNSALENGGGVFMFGSVSLATSNSTYSANTAISGGALAIVGNPPFQNPTVHVSNSTFVDNVSSFPGQGHHVSGAWSMLRLDNSILHLSPALQASNDACSGPVTTGNANLIGDGSCDTGGAAFSFGAVNGMATAPAYNGGFGRTYAISAASNAVDAGFPGLCLNSQTGNPLTVDQRRLTRPVDGNLDLVVVCDIGSVELQ